mmetsp:Transcript_19887/g.46549  ORF Transcript_19887/g.46549 Transcript_19887/m.46549 type:complete len:835 (+) Transcript_19887:55-2559(+)
MLLNDERPVKAEIIATSQSLRPRHKRLWSQATLRDWWACYADKLEGADEVAAESDGICHACSTFLGCFVFIALVGLFQEHVLPGLSEAYQVPLTALNASWGAAAIQVFSAWQHQGAQPRNVLLGNLIGSCAGLLAVLPASREVQVALAVAFTVAGQELTSTIHPAGAAIALISLQASECPWPTFCCMCCSISLLLVVVAALFNNLCMDRLYPQTWWLSSPGSGDTSPASVGFLAHAPQQWLPVYLRKLQGRSAPAPAALSYPHVCFSSLAAFVYMLSLASLNAWLGWSATSLIGPAAATVSIFSDWRGPNSQPWPCVVGCVLGALCGIVMQVMPLPGPDEQQWVHAAVTVALTAAAQELSHATFPAGGAIALSVIVMPDAGQLGWGFLLQPGILSSCMLVIYGTLLNNLQETRLYPRRWPWQNSSGAPLIHAGHSERNLCKQASERTRPSSSLHRVNAGVLLVFSQTCFLILLMFAEEIPNTQHDHLAGISLLTVVGLGLMRAFLRAYGLGAIGFCMVLNCLAVQWSMVLDSTLQKTVLKIGLASVGQGYYAAAALLVSFGALVGKIRLEQVLVVAIIELPCLVFTKTVLLKLNGPEPLVHDIAGTLSVHLFGALFGYAAACVLGPSSTDWLNESSYGLDLLSLLGTLCFWVCFPSMLLPEREHKGAFVRVVLALLGSTVSAFAASSLFNRGKLSVVSIRNAVFAGGVAVSAVADLLKPFLALAVGSCAGLLSTAGLRLASKDRDTCGVLVSHGAPAFLAGLLPVLLPGMRGQDLVPGNQVFGVVGTSAIAILSGGCCGQLLKRLEAPEYQELSFSDEACWVCAKDVPKATVNL